MIKANELRIGNWVDDPNDGRRKTVNIYQLGKSMFDDTKSCYIPIPLTPEILEKVGFSECADSNEYRVALPLGNGTDLVIETLGCKKGPYDPLISESTADEIPKNYSYCKSISYLHQLQNLYFALTGEELKIDL